MVETDPRIRITHPRPQDSEIHNFAKSELLDKNVHFQILELASRQGANGNILLVVAFNATYTLMYMLLPMSSPHTHLKATVVQLSVRIIHIDSLKLTVGFRSRFTWDRESRRHVLDLLSSDFVYLASPSFVLHFLSMPASLIEANLEVVFSSLFGEEIPRDLYASSSGTRKSSLNTLILLNEFSNFGSLS